MSAAAALALALRELSSDTAVRGAQPLSERAAASGVFSRRTKTWLVGYRESRFELSDTKGLRYLARLLSQPDRELHVLDLVALESAGSTEGADRGHAGPVLDERAKLAYRRRIDELEEEIDEARTWNDAERAARAELELDALTRQLAAAVGLGGRDRKAASAAERARVSVRKAIVAAISRVAEHDSDLGLLLATTVHTGTYCRYVPDPRLPVEWALTPHEG